MKSLSNDTTQNSLRSIYCSTETDRINKTEFEHIDIPPLKWVGTKSLIISQSSPIILISFSNKQISIISAKDTQRTNKQFV